ncbi:MAG TPA: hypothetical protein VFP84_11730 [Kofleriaceae bacterium]|nr:hypothetical protein [Kofleriaceae bacterium]
MANDATDTTTAQDGADDGVHRLRDIVVEEVSLVDRAANKRRFLIVKRSDMAKSRAPAKDHGKMAVGAKQPKAKAKPPSKATSNRSKAKPGGRSPGSDGAHARKAVDDEYDDDGDDEAEKTDGGEDEDNEDEAEKAAVDEDEDEDEAEKADDEYDDDEAEKADDAEDEDEDEAEKADDEYDDDEAEKAEEEEDEKAAKADNVGDDDDGSEDSGAIVLPAEVKDTILRALTQVVERLVAVADRIKDADSSDDDNAAYVPADLAEEIGDLGEVLEGIGDRLPTTKAIDKRGARMAKDRFDRFQKALELLSQVLKELTESKQSPAPVAGPGKRTTKRDAQPSVGDLITHVTDLLAVVQNQQQQIDRIHKAHGTSNAILVEGGARAGRAPVDVSWPLDMNRPISRDSVAKATSFYDDAE